MNTEGRGRPLPRLPHNFQHPMTKQQLIDCIRERRSFLCVGLDTDITKLPAGLEGGDNPVLTFNKAIIDATAPWCVAYKPNLAFYECMGVEGLQVFDQTVRYIRQAYPRHLIIADAKRGDIGNTAAMYAQTFFNRYDVDAVTVAPYMGADSVTPFLQYEGKWTIVLALTSNRGSHDFQLTCDDRGERLFEKVLRLAQQWGTPDNIMFVIGATQGSIIADVRRIAPDHFLLVPGIGAQGGSLDDVCRYGMNAECGLLVNASRSIIYASSHSDFAAAAAHAARQLQQQMEQQLLQHHII